MRTVVVALAFFLSSSALAQSLSPMDLERLRFSAGATDSLFVDTGRVLSDGSFRLHLLSNYERGVLTVTDTNDRDHHLIENRVMAWLAGAWSPTARLELSFRLPIIAYQNGDGVDGLVNTQEPDSAGLGTPEIGVRYALIERGPNDRMSLGLGLDIGLPGGSADAFGRQDGWAGLQIAPRVAAGWLLGPVVLGVNAGVRLRSNEQEPGRDFGSELEQAVVVATRGRGLRGEIALQAAESLVESDIAVELVAAARLPLNKSFEAYAFGGRGFTDIPGTPSLRAGLGISYVYEADPKPAAKEDKPVLAPHETRQEPAKEPEAKPAPESEPAPEAEAEAEAEAKPAVAPEPQPIPPPAATPIAAPARVPGDLQHRLAAYALVFPTGASTLEPSSAPQLDSAAADLKEYPNAVIRVEGHTDNTGPDRLNRTLSAERAASVRRSLIQRGISSKRLQTAGFGPDRPKETNQTVEGRAANRRAELVVLVE